MFKLVLTTCPDLPSAHHIADLLIAENLAACVNIIPSMVSIYKWQGEVEQSQESQLFIKTVERNVGKIESILAEHHPYDVPELIVVNIETGSEAYLAWLTENTNEKN